MNLILDNSNNNYLLIKKVIWLYFWLWLLEGALRKWVLPGLATPLLVVRDPVAIAIIYLALKNQVSFGNNYIRIGVVTTLLSIIFALLIGHQNLFVALYGARIMLLHFPLIFIIGKVFTLKDVEKLGRVLLLIAPFMTVLIALQFNSSQGAWVNRGIGGDIEGSGFTGAMGYFRPSGLFTFTNGVSLFFPWVSIFVFYFWLTKTPCNRFLLIVASISLIVALPLTISRTAVFWVLLIAITAILGIAIKGDSASLLKLLGGVFVLLFVLLLLQNTSIFQIGTEVFLARVDNANQGSTLKESIFLRMLENLIGPIKNLINYPLIDGRLGMGSNAGARILGFESRMVISEEELGRLFGERGILLGLLIYGVRTILTISLYIFALKKLRKKQLLPWLYMTVVFFALYQGQWSVPTTLGFGVMVTGFMISSLNE